jgi:hypothetical protein
MDPVESTGLADAGLPDAGLPDAGAGGGAEIVVMYVRAPGDEGGELEEQLRRVVARYAAVELRVVGPAIADELWSASGHPAPSVLILRAGVVVGGAMGSQLPQRELADMLHAAVSWPH